MLILVGIAGVFYLIVRTPANCFDGIKNQNELDVDCAGICAKVCKSEVLKINKKWTRFFKVGEGLYDIAAKIENPNVKLGVNKFNYRLALYDEKNVLIADYRGKTFLNPNEEKVIFAPEVFAGARIPKKAFIEFKEEEQVWQRIVPPEKRPAFSVLNVKIQEGASPKLSAEIENKSLYDAKSVNIVAVVYDENLNAMGVSNTNIDFIPKSSIEIAFFTWPYPFYSKVASWDILPRLDFTVPEKL